MGKEEVGAQMIEQVSDETWFSSMAQTSVGAQTEVSENGNTCPKLLFIFLTASAIRTSKHDGGGGEDKEGERMGKTEGRERQMGIGLT